MDAPAREVTAGLGAVFLCAITAIVESSGNATRSHVVQRLDQFIEAVEKEDPESPANQAGIKFAQDLKKKLQTI